MWTIEKITKIENFLKLIPCWDELLEKSEQNLLFLSADFIRAEWENIGWELSTNPKAAPFILVIREDDEPVGLFPLVKEKRRTFGFPVTVIRTLGHRYLDRSDMIVARNVREVTELVLEFLKKEEPDWNLVYLQNMVEGSAVTKQIEALFKKYRYNFGKISGYRSPYIEKSGTWETYFSTRSRNFHKRLKNKSNGLSKNAGPLIFREYASPEEASEALQVAFSIDSCSWKATQGTAISSTAASKKYWQTLTRYLAEKNRLRIWILWVNNQAIAFEYHVLYGRKIYSMKWSYHAAYQRYSPGLLLKCRSLESFWKQDIHEIDLLGVTDDFKEQWTDKKRYHENVYLYNRTFYSTLVFLLCFKARRSLSKCKHTLQKLWSH